MSLPRRLLIAFLLTWFCRCCIALIHYIVADHLRSIQTMGYRPLASVFSYYIHRIPYIIGQLPLYSFVYVSIACLAVGLLWLFRSLRPVLRHPWKAGLLGYAVGLIYPIGLAAFRLLHRPPGYEEPPLIMAGFSIGFLLHPLTPAIFAFLISYLAHLAREKKAWLDRSL